MALGNHLRSIVREAALALSSQGAVGEGGVGFEPGWEVMDRFVASSTEYALVRRVDAAAGVASLARREREVLALVRRGLTNKAVAAELNIAASTVSVLLHRAATKMGARSRAELLARTEAAEVEQLSGIPRRSALRYSREP